MTKKGVIGCLGTAVGLVVVAGVGGGLAIKARKNRPATVEVQRVVREDVVARVSCTGKVEAKRKVDISANVMGPIVNLAVREGDRVHRGQLLLQIDQAQLQAQTTGSEAALSALFAERAQARANYEGAQDAFERGERNHRDGVIPAGELERLRAARDAAKAAVDGAQRRIEQARATLEANRDSLNKTTITSPMDGIVTALPVEEGEIAVIGTMNNAGTKLMTISDMSEVQADMAVDETDVPSVQVGQTATLRIDALPDLELSGRVTEIASSPIDRQGQTNQAVEFSVKVVIDNPPESIRPGFSVSGEIDVGSRTNVLAIPVQALVVQDMAKKIKEAAEAEKEGRTQDEQPGRMPEKRDVEGVYRLDGEVVKFVPVETGLQGELEIEIRSGLEEGDQIVTGPFRVLRGLKDGDRVQVSEDKPHGAA